MRRSLWLPTRLFPQRPVCPPPWRPADTGGGDGDGQRRGAVRRRAWRGDRWGARSAWCISDRDLWLELNKTVFLGGCCGIPGWRLPGISHEGCLVRIDMTDEERDVLIR